jgi:hypothetical protein
MAGGCAGPEDHPARNPHDAKDLLLTSLEDPAPVMLFKQERQEDLPPPVCP